MKRVLVVVILLSLACGGLGNDNGGGGGEPVAGDGLCAGGLHAAMTWQGEYPGPVVDVQQPVTLKFRRDPCSTVEGECTLAAGLYHPWAMARKATGFATVRPVLRYEATRNFTDEEGVSFQKGDIVEVTAYLGEGFCAFRRNGVEDSGYCPNMFDEGVFTLLNPEAEQIPQIQLFEAPCQTGGSGWFVVDDALARPEVKEGVITGYGEVGPHGTAGGL